MNSRSDATAGNPGNHDRGVAEKTYIFPVTLESHEDDWRAFSPPLESMGASTWGETREEALKNTREVLAPMLEEFLDEGKDIVEQGVAATEGAVITITR